MVSKKLPLLILVSLFSVLIYGQNQERSPSQNIISQAVQPYLFSVNTLTADSPIWSIDYSGGYGERVEDPFGYEGVDQQVAVKGYLGNRFTLYARAAFGFPDGGSVSSAQQAEVIRDIIGGEKTLGFRLGLGLGGRFDYENVGAATGRITASYDTSFWRLNGNLLFEKAFSDDRDAIDIITSIGFQYRIFGNFYAGAEALGEDLEGFWDDEEAEGGAKVLVGPSLNLTPNASRFSFSLCGGPVIYATQSQMQPSEAIRDLPQKNGFTVRASILYNL